MHTQEQQTNRQYHAEEAEVEGRAVREQNRIRLVYSIDAVLRRRLRRMEAPLSRGKKKGAQPGFSTTAFAYFPSCFIGVSNIDAGYCIDAPSSSPAGGYWLAVENDEALGTFTEQLTMSREEVCEPC